MSFLYKVLPEYTRNSDILTDNNVSGQVKTLEEFLNVIDTEIFDIAADSVREILTFTSVYDIKDEYLPYLGYLLGYNWNNNLDSEIQRNILANIIELYKRKGTKFSFNFNLYHLDPTVVLYEPYKDIFMLNQSGFGEPINKEYYSNIKWKVPVDAATTENINLIGEQIIDSVTVKKGNRVLVKDQNNRLENGVYIVSDSEWSKAEDSDSCSKISRSLYYVKFGRINANKGWICVSSDETNGIIFERIRSGNSKRYHLSSREYYSWGILVLKVNNLSNQVFELMSMVKPAGWKILVETYYGLYYNLHTKISETVRNKLISDSGIIKNDFEFIEDYYDFVYSLHYSLTSLYVEAVLMGHMFDFYGDHFRNFINNYITFNDIKHYTLNDNIYSDEEYSLLRYSTHYAAYSNNMES